MPEKVHTLEFFLFSSADWYSHNWQENENITSNIIFQPMHTECKPPLSQIELHIEPNNLPRSAWALQSVLADGLPLLLAKQHRVLPGEFLGLGVESELQFLVCVKILILNLLRLQDAWAAYDRRAETKEERKRTRTTKRYTSNSLKLVEEVTPQIFFLDTKPFVISTDELFQLDAYF